MTEKGKRAGIGVGMFGGAGLVGLYALGALIAAAILALATAITPWLAALVDRRRLRCGRRRVGADRQEQGVAGNPTGSGAGDREREGGRPMDEGQGRGGPAMRQPKREERTEPRSSAEIEETRAELGDTVEALVAKTDVKAQAKQAVTDAKATVADKAADVKQTVAEQDRRGQADGGRQEG